MSAVDAAEVADGLLPRPLLGAASAMMMVDDGGRAEGGSELRHRYFSSETRP